MQIFRKKEEENSKDMVYAVIGLGRFGTAIAKTLCLQNQTVIVADKDQDRVAALRDYTPYAFVIDHMTKEALDEIGIRNCQVAIVAIGTFLDVSILTTLHLVNLGIPRVIAKATSPEHGQILQRLGAQVVYPEQDMGEQLAVQLLSKNLVGYLALDNQINVYELLVPDSLIGKTVFEEDIRGKYGLNIAAIERDQKTITNITPETEFEPGDMLVVIGSISDVQAFEQKYAEDYSRE